MSKTLILLVLTLWAGREADAGSVKLAWDPNPEGNIGGYRVYRASAPDASYVLIGSTLAGETFYRDDTAEQGGNYCYKVAAVTRSGLEGRRTLPLCAYVSRYDPGLQVGAIVVRAAAPSDVLSGQVVSLSGAVWTSAGSPATVSWKQVSGPSVPVTGSQMSEAGIIAPVVSDDTTMSFVFSAADVTGLTGSDTLRIKVHRR